MDTLIYRDPIVYLAGPRLGNQSDHQTSIILPFKTTGRFGCIVTMIGGLGGFTQPKFFDLAVGIGGEHTARFMLRILVIPITDSGFIRSPDRPNTLVSILAL